AVAEEQGVTRHQARRHRGREQRALHGVRREHHHQVGLLAGVRGGEHPQPLRLGLLPAAGPLGQADPHVDAGVAQRQRVRVSLAAVAEYGHRAVLDQRQVGVVVVEHPGGHEASSLDCLSWTVVCGESGRTVERGPRPTATMPDCTISLIPYGSSTLSSAASLSAVPVASIVTDSVPTSTILARNRFATSSTALRTAASARTLTSSSSRCTDWAGSSSTILMTLTSLLSCLVTCSSGSWSTLTTMVIRDMSGCSVGPTASDSMLKPRRLNNPETRASTPGSFSTSTDSVWVVLMASLPPRPRPAARRGRP